MTGLKPQPYPIEGEVRFKREDALAVAEGFVDFIRSTCERVEIAGSIRRGKVWVKDIEIVAVPRFVGASENLFGEPQDPINSLLHLLDLTLAGLGPLEKRLDASGKQCYGPRHQRLVLHGVPLDLFQVVAPASWGAIFTIRTGPAKYSQNLVTQQSWGGCMPRGMRVQDGCLWRGEERIDTPEEADFFRELGIEMPDPSQRRNPL